MAFDLDDEELKATRILNGADKKMNIEEAIERMHDLIRTCNAGIEKYGIYDDLFQKDKEAIETVLNMLKEKDREIAKKDKIIDLMADCLYKDDTSFGYGKLKNVNTPNEIKQYFEQKATNDG